MAARKKIVKKKAVKKKAEKKKGAKKKAVKKKSARNKTKKNSSELEKCSFCGNDTSEVKHLIKGEDGYICDVCTETCVDVLQDIQKKNKEKSGISEKTSLTYIYQLLRRHFKPNHTSELITSTREFPLRMRVDLQRVLDDLMGSYYESDLFTGIHSSRSRDGLGFADLLEEDQHAATISPARFDELDIGEDNPVRCLNNGLWLGEFEKTKFSILLSLKRDYMGGGSVHVEITTPPGEAGNKIIRYYFNQLEKAVNQAGAYRGKVLSLEREHPYSGKSAAILVHKLPEVGQEDIILPKPTLDLLDKSIIGFSQLKPELSNLNMSVKKGVLFYGPPGTGKTHSVKYIASALEDHTTLLITADQIGNLSEYMLLARLLQPSIVVIEDVDLIAKARETMMDAGVETLLNKLLNEMDGLKENNNVLFILTTNRPEVLEEALAERPGRVDQAVEFPLPDVQSRNRLARLYARGLEVPDALYELIVEKTENVSPAFIKELMRRIAQNKIIDKSTNSVNENHVNGALEEMLFASGKLNISVLGGDNEQ